MKNKKYDPGYAWLLG